MTVAGQRPRGRPRIHPDRRTAVREAMRAWRKRKKAKVYLRHASDDWHTPRQIVDTVLRAAGRAGGSFDLDPCAPWLPDDDTVAGQAAAAAYVSAAGDKAVAAWDWEKHPEGPTELYLPRRLPVPAAMTFTAGADGLTLDWDAHPGLLIWCNPPFSQKQPWLVKCAAAARAGAVVVALVPASPGTQWWRSLVAPFASAVVLPGRPVFLDVSGEPARHGATFGVALCVYGDDGLADKLVQAFQGTPIPRMVSGGVTAVERT